MCVTEVEYRWHDSWYPVDVHRELSVNGFEGSIDAVSNLTQLFVLYDLSHVMQSVLVVMWVVGK